MTAESVCFAALPGALPAALAEAMAGEDLALRRLTLSESSEQQPREIEAGFLAPRLLPRLFREPAVSRAQAALIGMKRLIVLLPTGRYDDGVWAPIIERILRGVEAAGGPRDITLAWSGLGLSLRRSAVARSRCGAILVSPRPCWVCSNAPPARFRPCSTRPRTYAAG